MGNIWGKSGCDAPALEVEEAGPSGSIEMKGSNLLEYETRNRRLTTWPLFVPNEAVSETVQARLALEENAAQCQVNP